MKKLISTLMALSLTLTSMAALSSNAAIFIYNSDSDEYQDVLDGYSLLIRILPKDTLKMLGKMSSFTAMKTVLK